MNGPVGTGGMRWRCIEAAAELLAPVERELVLGDLAETDRGVWRGLGDVLSLAALRQIALWKSWRPWAASLGLALPASLFLMGCSVAATGAISSFFNEPLSPPLLWRSASRMFLLICWAWMSGFAVSAISRGTMWASLLGCCTPCLYCLSKWPGHGFSELQLLIFLVPGLWGAWRGRQNLRLGLGSALFLTAIAMLAPLMSTRGGWMYGCWLLWPGCYLAVTARHRPA
jgi:hypothetical protein